MNREKFLEHIKWCFDNDMNHLVEVFLDEYMEGYQSDESYNDGFDDGYRECLSENGSVDLDDVEIDYDYFRERFDDMISEEIDYAVDEELGRRESFIREEGYVEGYREGYDEGRDKGYEEGRGECE